VKLASSPSVGLTGLAALWLGSVLFCLALLWSRAAQPSRTATPPGLLPAAWREGTREAPTLLMAVHPRCPCTRATLAELARLLARARPVRPPILLFFKPRGAEDSWIETSLLNSARRLGCEIRVDSDGDLARSLGLLSSGTVALYRADGTLAFHGGITAGRGHEGENLGQASVEEALQGRALVCPATQAFGCPISDDPVSPGEVRAAAP